MASHRGIAVTHYKPEESDDFLIVGERTSADFEQKLLLLLETVIQPLEAIPLPSRSTCSAAYGRWQLLLSEIYRPVGVTSDARQNAEELLCRCLINAETLGKALELVSKHPESSLFTRPALQTIDRTASLSFDRVFDLPAFKFLELTNYWKLLSWLVGEQILLNEVQFSGFHKLEPGAAKLASTLFEREVQTGEVTSISFDKSWIDRPIVRTYKDLRTILALPSLALIPWTPIGSFKSRVWQLMEKSVNRHGLMLSLNEAAHLLGRSSSTLRRQLVREGTSFQTIKNNWRQQQAEELLQTTPYPLDKISALLGYESTSVFSRAFKCWTGWAPSAYRHSRKVSPSKPSQS